MLTNTVLTMIVCVFFFFNDTATTEIYTLSLHDALPIFGPLLAVVGVLQEHPAAVKVSEAGSARRRKETRSEEHTSELQSQSNLVCRLLLEKKKSTTQQRPPTPHRIRLTRS